MEAKRLHFHRYKMIVLGVSPGIKKLAYCVIEPVGDPADPEWELLDLDRLKGAKVAATALAAFGASELVKKFKVHDLILSTIWERYTPEVMVVGPPADPAESERLVSAARRALRSMAASYGMEYIEIKTLEELADCIECGGTRNLRRAVADYLEYRKAPRDGCKIVAMASAVAATVPKRPAALPPADRVPGQSVFDYVQAL